MVTPTLESVITVAHYVEAVRICQKNVGYKLSVQNYVRHSLHHIADTVNLIKSGRVPKLKGTDSIVITERGHKRIITPIKIEDRVTQRVLCDYALLPAIEGKLIYDNGASTRGKGTEFSRKRMNQHLEEAKRKWGADHVYALKFDFKSFFASIPHSQCYRVLDEAFEDKRLRDLIMRIIESYQEADILKIEDPEIRRRELQSLRRHEKVGICLGSQISQIMALLVPDAFDHFVKDKLGLKYYIRHMDDGIILLNDPEELGRIKELLAVEAARYGLTLHPKKTSIVSLKKGFTFLKVRYQAKSGRTVKTLAKSGIIRMRRKLKKFAHLVKERRMHMDDVYVSIQSWLSHSRIASAYRARRNMLLLYDRLYGGYRITRLYWRNNEKLKRKRKVRI